MRDEQNSAAAPHKAQLMLEFATPLSQEQSCPQWGQVVLLWITESGDRLGHDLEEMGEDLAIAVKSVTVFSPVLPESAEGKRG
jgi:hypothetical protein